MAGNTSYRDFSGRLVWVRGIVIIITCGLRPKAGTNAVREQVTIPNRIVYLHSQ